MTNDKQQGALDLDKLEALARAATPGPWLAQTVAGYRGALFDVRAEHQRGVAGGIGEPSNAAFIAAANPAAVLDLIALARRASQPSAEMAAWDYELFGISNEELIEMWRACGHSGTVPFSFAGRIQEKLSDAIAASRGEADKSRRAAGGEVLLLARSPEGDPWQEVDANGYEVSVCVNAPGKNSIRLEAATPAPTSAAQAGQVAKLAEKIAANEKPLDAESRRLFNENRWDMYATDERAAAPADRNVLEKLCSQLEGMRRTMFNMPGTGQNYSYLLWEDASFYVEEARKHLDATASVGATGRAAEGATQAGELYECIGKGGKYEVLGVAFGAGQSKLVEPLTIYRGTDSGQLYFRTADDFRERMARIAGDKQGAQGGEA